MKILLLFFLSSVAMAQTAAVPPLTVPIPARVIPAQTVSFTAKNGGKETFTIPAQTLPAQTKSTAATTAPVAGRHRIAKHFPHRLPRYPKLKGDRTLTPALNPNRTPYTPVKLHLEHPSGVP
jgi:hypothetical protein